MSKLYIENRDALALITESLNLAAKTETWLCKEIKTQLSKIKHIRKSNWLAEIESWDCGRQDAFGDKIDHEYRRWKALKLARRIQKGDATKLNETFKIALGLD